MPRCVWLGLRSFVCDGQAHNMREQCVLNDSVASQHGVLPLIMTNNDEGVTFAPLTP